jgi:hypothetical protein
VARQTGDQVRRMFASGKGERYGVEPKIQRDQLCPLVAVDRAYSCGDCGHRPETHFRICRRLVDSYHAYDLQHGFLAVNADEARSMLDRNQLQVFLATVIGLASLIAFILLIDSIPRG